MSSSGVMQFTLGLSAAGFTRGLDMAGQKAGSFVKHLATLSGTGVALELLFTQLKVAANVVEGVLGTIERGAGLEKLSRTTGESVRSLYLLQQGLKAVGMDANGAGPMVMRLQKSLGGINEEGLPTGHVFAQLGLNLEDLKKLDAPAALQAIAKSMAGLNNASATAAAGQIFGRGTAAEFLALVRSSKEFGEALKQNAAAAAQMAKNAAIFERVERAFNQLRDKTKNIFAGLATAIAPVLETVLDWINQIDFKKIADSIRDAFDFVAEAFSQGKLTELLGAAFEAGVERFGNLFFGLLGNSSFWGAIWDVAWGSFLALDAKMLGVFLSLGTALKAAFMTAVDFLLVELGKIPKVGKWLGLEGRQSTSFSDIYASFREDDQPGHEMLNQLAEAGKQAAAGGLSKFKQTWSDASANAGGPAQERLQALASGLWNAVQRRRAGQKPGENPATQGRQLGVAYRPESTNLEKMGFVLGGGRSGDPARDTARNTKEMVGLLQNLPNAMAKALGPAAPNFANA